MDVKTLCLGALSMGDATGYDIKKLFEEAFSHFFVAGYGSIYPALEKLTEEGHVSCRRQRQQKRPDKKVFSITPAGRETLVRTLEATPPKEKLRSEFLVLMFFAHLMSPARLGEVLQEFLDEKYQDLKMLEELEKRNYPPGIEFTIRYGLMTTRAAIACIEHSRDTLVREVYSTRNRTPTKRRRS